MSKTFNNFVDGEWTPSVTDNTFESRNPAQPAEVVGRFQQSGEEDAKSAIKAAAGAADDWAATPGPKRGRVLNRTATVLEEQKGELTETLVREEGKARPEAAGEVQRTVDIFYYYAAKARDLGGDVKASSSRDTRLYTVREPVGVVAAITPWNYPIAIPAWKLAPALATGNAIVFKPASLAPNIARKLVECLEEAGLPDGVLNLVTGPGSSVGTTFSTHEDVDAVSFTGSSAVGGSVYEAAAPDQKRVQLEMGGKNPLIVSDTADVEEAADIVAAGAFGVTGQACTSTSRAIVYEDVYDEFVEVVVERARDIDIGPGLTDADMGPQVSESELEGTLEFIEIAESEGATLSAGGGTANAEGYFVEPTVFSDVEPDMRIAQEEVFGPVLAVIPVSGYDDAVEVANSVNYGLSASIVTEDLTEAHSFVEDVEAGVVKVNEKTTGLELHVPFGGVKQSSSNTYREQGDAALNFFTTTKTAYLTY